IAADVPFLAVCIGFQLLYEGSDENVDENGQELGLGIFPGRVTALAPTVKHPQMQWNQLELVGPELEPGPASLRGLGPRPWVYFVHSFAPPVGAETVAVCDYGGPVAALVALAALRVPRHGSVTRHRSARRGSGAPDPGRFRSPGGLRGAPDPGVAVHREWCVVDPRGRSRRGPH